MIRKSPFIVLISLLLSLGFAATTLVSYLLANQSLNQHIRTNTLPLTSDNIYSEIQRDLLQPILVSSLMAQDTFVRGWVLGGEQNPEEITRYLASIQKKYNAVTAFFISDSSLRYYHSSGILKQVSPDNPSDDWYFRVEGLSSDFEINLDQDAADPGRTTLFVNHKVLDFQGKYIGTIGVGLASDVIMTMIETYQQRYGRQVYFANKQGDIVLHGSMLKNASNLRAMEGINEIATQILTSQGGTFSYRRDGQNTFLKSRFISQLNWYLLVEQQQQTSNQVTDALWINLALSAGITLVILTLAFLTLNHFQNRIEELASRDQLTQTANRNNFEAGFDQMVYYAHRQRQNLSIIVTDIDHFKSVNDNFGHLAGDRILTQVAAVLSAQLRKSDVICRWGGEEFLVVLPDCNLTFAASIAEKMRKAIETNIATDDTQSISASFGVAELENETETSQQLFARADAALYDAKAKGRNCVCCATQSELEPC
ncbi:MAG: sensor domain-containing diguanylate cyclase [Cellvibrionaceae bacterium]